MAETRDLLDIRSLHRDQIELLVHRAVDLKGAVDDGKKLPDLSGKTLGLLFFENSTRTRVSFERAAHYLNMQTSSFIEAASSISKGETLKDTILTLQNERLDGLVIRHKSSGSAAFGAQHFEGPVVNAGDGCHEHPTQALGDAMTILERKGTLEGLKVAIVGDVLHSRVARSNAWLLSKYGAEIRFVGPRNLIPINMSRFPGTVYNNLYEGIADADVLICLRLQRERMNEGLLSSLAAYARLYQVDSFAVGLAAKDCIVMHPGPINRGVEIDDEVADGPHSVVTAQVENGVFVRMAALEWVFGAAPQQVRTASKRGAK
ncbi:MAG: aspartate carbamoyltransferase catalytic subunit [Fimbriimonadaceae bacterium]